MRLLFTAVLSAALVAPGCASIPQASRAVPAAPAPAAAAGMEVCLLVGEQRDRRQFEGTALLSAEPWRAVIGTVLIRHPKGLVAVDPAFGTTIATDVRRSPPWFKIIAGEGRTKKPLVQLLDEVGLRAQDVDVALLTHAHWDHTGALRDLPRARVLMQKDELAFVRGLERYVESGAMPHHFDFDQSRISTFTFTGPAYEGFEASYDIFGDGSIVAVPLPGHTPGSVGYFVNAGPERRWLLIGDTAWSIEGVRQPVHKNPLVRPTVDSDLDTLGESLAFLHAFQKQRPDVKIVPAHDLSVLESIPECSVKSASAAQPYRAKP